MKDEGAGLKSRKQFGKSDYISGFVAFICFILSLCPYTLYKKAADSFSPDGLMESMTPQRVTGIRTAFFGVFLFFLILILWKIFAPDSRKAFFRSLFSLPVRCIHDIPEFFHDLRKAFRPGGMEFWIFLVIFLAGIIIRMLRINSPLLHDEAYSMAIWGRSDMFFAISDYHLPNNHVFHTIFLNLIYHHLGKSPALMRLPVFLSGCLLIPAVWILGKLFYNEFVGLVGAGFTAFAPFLIFYSVNARGYEIQALLTVLTVGLAVYGRRKKNIFSWFLLILLSAPNFFTLPIALYPFGGICVWLFLNVVFFDANEKIWKNRWQLLKYLLFMGCAVSVISMLLYVPLLRYSGWNSFFGNVFIGAVETSTFSDTMVSRLRDSVQAFTGSWPVIVSLSVGWGILLSVFLFKKNSRERVSFGLALLIWMGLLIPFQKPNLWPRTLLFLHPLLLIFAASGLSILQLFPRFQIAGKVFCAVLLILAGVSQIKTDISAGPNERAIQTMIDREGENVSNIHVVTAPQDDAPLWVYADFYGLPQDIFDRRESFNTIYAFVNPQNEADFSPTTLDDLLDQFGPGNYFIDFDSAEILIDEENAVLYRFSGKEETIRKAYGEYPEIAGK